MSAYIIVRKKSGIGLIPLPRGWNKTLVLELVTSDDKLQQFLKEQSDAPIQQLTLQSSEKQPAEKATAPRYIFIRENDRFRKILFRDILFIEASGSYCVIHLAQGDEVMLSLNLTRIWENLSPDVFLRVHRSYIVNREHIDYFDLNVVYVKKHRIPVSRQHQEEVRQNLNVLSGKA